MLYLIALYKDIDIIIINRTYFEIFFLFLILNPLNFLPWKQFVFMVGPRFKKIQSCLLSSRTLMGFFNFENSMVFSILQLLNFEISSIYMPLKPNKQVMQEEESDIKVVLQQWSFEYFL